MSAEHSPNLSHLSLHSSTSSLTNINDESCGSIELITGPMFSGKTTELCRRMDRYTRTGVKTIMIKYTKDTRFDEKKVATHNPRNLYDGYTILVDSLPSQKDCEIYPIIGIDEGQFFVNLGEFCNSMAVNGHLVIVAGLNSTFERKPWDEISKLIAFGPKIDSYTAVCDKCKRREAEFSHRTIFSADLVLIGSSDKYKALCRKCYEEENKDS